MQVKYTKTVPGLHSGRPPVLTSHTGHKPAEFLMHTKSEHLKSLSVGHEAQQIGRW